LDDLRADILERLEAHLERGESLDAAVAAVHRQIIDQGESDLFVREFGLQTIRDLWRYSNRQSRGQAFAAGTRRHDPSRLAEDDSLFEVIYKIGDDWVRLGDCTRAMCESGAALFRAQAAGNMREAWLFSHLAAKLRGAQTVRSRFTEEAVRAILQGFKLG
jgi:hypothetical protein